MVAFESSVLIMASVADVVSDPGSNAHIADSFVKTFPVPGTPAQGVGHQYCNLYLDENGNTIVLLSEIEEFDPPRRLTRRILNAGNDFVRQLTIEEVGEGTLYTIRTQLAVRAVTSHILKKKFEDDVDRTLAKVKAQVESTNSR